MDNYEAETQGEEKGKKEAKELEEKNGSRGTQRGLQAQRDGRGRASMLPFPLRVNNLKDHSAEGPNEDGLPRATQRPTGAQPHTGVVYKQEQQT